MNVDWTDISAVEVPNGKLAVTDPMLFPGLEVQVPAGRYAVLAGFEEVDGERQFTRLRVVNTSGPCEMSIRLGEVSVDFAQLTVGDAELMENAGRTIQSMDDAAGMLAALETDEDFGHVPWNLDGSVTTPFVRTPGGDGVFPVYALEANGSLAGIEIVFIED